jgi:hypothetical protein
MPPLLLAISLCLPPTAPTASMCSCLIRPGSDSARALAELSTADVVFVGKVTSVVDTAQPGGVVQSRRATFTLQLGWKGPVDRSITVLTPTSGAACGFEFAVGTQYLVFAMAEASGVIHTRGCSPTQPLATAREYLVGLGKPRIRYASADSGSRPR